MQLLDSEIEWGEETKSRWEAIFNLALKRKLLFKVRAFLESVGTQ